MTEAALGRLEDLPAEYVAALASHNAVPAWPNLRNVLPNGKPNHKTQPHVWSYKSLRPLLLRAGELTPIEQAERRVLMLANPGLEGKPFATASIFFGLQLILPGETAPNHRHSPSAVRLVMEGAGAYTTVEGQRCAMAKGDVILTPAHLWHEHGHEGDGPMIWLDALDLPITMAIEAAYGTPGRLQVAEARPDASQTRYRRAGLVPYERLDRQAERYAQFRYPWVEVRAALLDLARDTPLGNPVQLAYVNPETGLECMPVLGFSALMLRPGEEVILGRSSASSGFLVVGGRGETRVNGGMLAWEENDVVAMPSHSAIAHRNLSAQEPAFLIQVDDAPMQRKLGFYERFE